jgi:hypothetical protein|uniref:Uncharacterized protein n=1 Tax=viral metagenome TaxID=1070528 RepID=A0A6C0CYB7_9ZZZZ
MDNIDDDWESFLQNDCELDMDNPVGNISTDYKKYLIDSQMLNENNIPKCSDIYISTKTKISYLNNNNINIKDIFWKIPILNYSIPKNGVIKKQIKYSSTSPEEVQYIEEQLKDITCYEEQIIEHIENPEGRIKYKDQRKISIGVCKKDLLSYRSKKKRAFFNCFVLILRIMDKNEFKEMHVKVFNTGKLEIPGIQTEEMLSKLLNSLIDVLKPFLGDDLSYDSSKTETVLINSNFNCGYYIDRDKLHDILKYKYRINSNFDACSYPGIQSKFYYDKTVTGEQDGQQPKHKDYYEVSFMIFRTGSVLVVGRCDELSLEYIYRFLKNILENEYQSIISSSVDNKSILNKNRKKKIRKKILCFD